MKQEKEKQKDVYVIINKQYLDTIINSLKHLEMIVLTMNDHQTYLRSYITEIKDYAKLVSEQEDSIEQVKTQ